MRYTIFLSTTMFFFIASSFFVVNAQTRGRDAISAPVGKHIREARQNIEFEARDCRSYSAGAGIGCRTAASDLGINVIKLGAQRPCRRNGTVQLDFTEDFYLVGVTCGSNKELMELFIRGMNASYGPGESTGSKQEEYMQTTWKDGTTTIKVAETILGGDSLYKVSVYRKP